MMKIGDQMPNHCFISSPTTKCTVSCQAQLDVRYGADKEAVIKRGCTNFRNERFTSSAQNSVTYMSRRNEERANCGPPWQLFYLSEMSKKLPASFYENLISKWDTAYCL
ncbi:hypothetical protein HELRODRAFT_172178 [Helobdella robusta]|uniref:Uncharacterized protein n=1 Tax=Helobdella robusta TaxID=6412 RepID=T1F546_HELRO|nr:hypothetical protein HELRODRAFT_172178 [Helobdella robusta]ESO04530.1 hypothetical protein HELRODRAFT_172178 [Helobdella robusta]